MPKPKFRGLRRKHGRAGIRNDLWVIPTTACLNGPLKSLLASYSKQYWIDSVRLLEYGLGCSKLAGGGNLWAAERAAAALALHPNTAGALVVGLGCEDFPMRSLMDTAEAAGAGAAVHALTYGDVPEEDILIQLDKLGANAPRTRELFALSDLFVGISRLGMGCNYAAGPCGLLDRIEGWLARGGGSLLRTASTGGSSGAGILPFGERAAKSRQTQTVATPDNLPGALTSLSLSGAQVLLCDSARPSPVGAPVPLIRIRPETGAGFPGGEWIDFDPAQYDEAARGLADLVMAVAEGERTINERRNIHDVMIDPGSFSMHG